MFFTIMLQRLGQKCYILIEWITLKFFKFHFNCKLFDENISFAS